MICAWCGMSVSEDGESVLIKEYEFEALTCIDVRTTAAYSGRRFCSEDRLKEEYGLRDLGEGGVYTVVQFNPIRTLKGIRCEKKMSSITAVCGAFSHSKLVAPPDILAPVRVPHQECKEVFMTQLLTTEDQRQVRALLGSTTIYKYIESGAVTMSEHNVACEGGDLKIYGKKHDNVIKLVTVSFTISQVDVSEKNSRMRTSEDGILPRACLLALEGCSLDDMTLVVDMEKNNLCPYSKIRVSRFSTMENMENSEGNMLLVNDEHKLLFEVGDKKPVPIECQVKGNLISTNFERIFLIMGEMGNGIDMIESKAIDLELEARVSDYYLAYWSERVVMESEVKWQNQICQITSANLDNDQVLLHENHLLKRQGELILEFVCSPVRVRTRIGHKMEGETCFDHLPVFMPDNKVAYLAPITRVLTPRNAVNTINCSTHYPYVFEDVNGKLITANPGIQELKVEVSDHHFLDAKSRNHSDVFKFSSLLYTPEEVEAYEQMLQGHNAEKAVTRKFSSFYCSTTGECTPSKGTSDFRWQKLVNPEEMLEEWWEEVKWHVIWWGVIWACLDSVVTLVQFIAKLIFICRNLGKRDLSCGAMFRFVFLPGNELLNLFPHRDDQTVTLGRTPDIGFQGNEMQNLPFLDGESERSSV